MAHHRVTKKHSGRGKTLDWPHDRFVVPDHILEAWRSFSRHSKSLFSAWSERVSAQQAEHAFTDTFRNLPEDALTALRSFKENLASERPQLASRVASQKTLEVINPHTPYLIGGSADLTGSNNTLTPDLQALTPGERKGRYVHYGIREHAMAAIMNGLALHGHFTPYGGTFLVFSDYARPAMRLSALMGQRVIYVMTHDSIGLGEDGPTHQPIEHLAALRAMPGLPLLWTR
jgi:Transketolase